MVKRVSNLSKIAAGFPEAGREALLQTAADIVDMAKQLVPVDTGALQRSIGADPVDSTNVRIGSDKEYAPIVEFGGVRQSAQPYLTPSFLMGESTFKVRLKQAVEKAVRKR